jgi:FkbM family methyltransferase
MSYFFKRIYSKIIELSLHYISKKTEFIFYLNPKEYITSQILCYGLHERDLLYFILSKIPSKYLKGQCLDVGANIGNHTLFFSRFYNKIHSFEPVLSTFKALDLNITINNKANKVNLYNVALSNIKGSVRFFEFINGDIGCSRIATSLEDKPNDSIEYSVEVRKGDDYFESYVDISLIKIDAEGHEFNILKGLSNTIKSNMPFIIFEDNLVQSGGCNQTPIEYLKSIGYCNFYSPQLPFYNYNSNYLKYFMRLFVKTDLSLVDLNKIKDGKIKSQLCIASPFLLE